MSICTRCPYGVADGSGDLLPEYKGKNYDDMPCKKCELLHGKSIMRDGDRSNHGRSALSMEAMLQENGEDFDDAECTMWGEERPDVFDGEKKTGLWLATELARLFNRLPYDTMRIVAYKITHPGKSLFVPASELGISIQAAHARLERACQYEAIQKVIKLRSKEVINPMESGHE